MNFHWAPVCAFLVLVLAQVGVMVALYDLYRLVMALTRAHTMLLLQIELNKGSESAAL
jgi:hypothetical protein